MKKKSILSFAICLVAFNSLCAQTPSKFNFQGIARNSNGALLISTKIKLRFSIIDSSSNGTVLYKENRNATTDSLGMFTVAIGGNGATNVTGSISAINWAKNDKYLKTEMDPAGGTAFVNLGTTQLLSVPYAEQSRKTDSANVANRATSLKTIAFLGSNPFAGVDVFSGETKTLLFSPQNLSDTSYNQSTGVYTIPSRGYYYIGFSFSISTPSNTTTRANFSNAIESYPVYFNNTTGTSLLNSYSFGRLYFLNKGIQISVSATNNINDGTNKFTINALPGGLSIYKISE